jgi:SAM-dependent methyltransferase
LEKKISPVSFDDYVETYHREVQSSIDFIGQDVDFFIKLKADIVYNIARSHFPEMEGIKILDIGSGIGLTDSHLSKRIQNLYGVDIEKKVVAKAMEKNPGVKYEIYDGLILPFEDDAFDMIFTINVMHHIKPLKWHNFIKEAGRVIKRGGVFAVFEHNPLNPLTRLAVSRCEFDRDAVLIRKARMKKMFREGGFRITTHSYIVFFPFNRTFFRKIENCLTWLPLGAQYFVTGTKN